MTVLLETREVSKAYGVFRALDKVSMAVHEDEFVSVVGPNGAGKTTLVNLLTGLLLPTEGEVLSWATTLPVSGRSRSPIAALPGLFSLFRSFLS